MLEIQEFTKTVLLQNYGCVSISKVFLKTTIEKNYFAQWDSVNFKKVVILNDNKSEFQFLITILDLIKKYKIENVNFSNEPK